MVSSIASLISTRMTKASLLAIFRKARKTAYKNAKLNGLIVHDLRRTAVRVRAGIGEIILHRAAFRTINLTPSEPE